MRPGPAGWTSAASIPARRTRDERVAALKYCKDPERVVGKPAVARAGFRRMTDRVGSIDLLESYRGEAKLLCEEERSDDEQRRSSRSDR